eukprot:1160927-Pelagomonas_calceolata.AAC.1
MKQEKAEATLRFPRLTKEGHTEIQPPTPTSHRLSRVMYSAHMFSDDCHGEGVPHCERAHHAVGVEALPPVACTS